MIILITKILVSVRIFQNIKTCPKRNRRFYHLKAEIFIMIEISTIRLIIVMAIILIIEITILFIILK